jgi:hypothetical protein
MLFGLFLFADIELEELDGENSIPPFALLVAVPLTQSIWAPSPPARARQILFCYSLPVEVHVATLLRSLVH